MATSYTSHAVAVRDGADLWTVLIIRRASTGDVYVNFPRDAVLRWEPHVSHHASGQQHHKSFGKKMGSPRSLKKPGPGFAGQEDVALTTISVAEARAINERCDPADYSQVFDVPAADLPAGATIQLAVELLDAHTQPKAPPGDKLIRRHTFADALPRIAVTVFEPSPLLS